MNERRIRRALRGTTLAIAVLAASLVPAAAGAQQVLLGTTSAQFSWQPATGEVEFYEVWVSRSSRDGGFALEQTVSGQSNSTLVQAQVGEVVRVRVRAGNDKAFSPMSPASASVRFGLPPSLPPLGSPGVVAGRAAGSDTRTIFYADSESGATWRFEQDTPEQTPTQLGEEPDARWQLVASGDFDGDGAEDLFWQHENGATRIWYLDGDSYQEELSAPRPGPEFRAELTADFDGNGQDDVFWRDPVAPTLVWFRAGVDFSTFHFPPMPADAWEILSAGDFDGDGRDDLFWRNLESTITSIWFTAGSAETGIYAQVRGSNYRALSWEVAETRDEDGDGRDDLRWQLAESPDLVEWWHMDGEQVRRD